MKTPKSPSKPRVTEILRKLGLSKSYDGVDPFYRDRGTACHKAIDLYLKDELDESSIDESYRGHFEGFLKFYSENPLGMSESEVHLENDDYQGTIDLVSEFGIYDWKCSKSHDKVAEIQGAGYKKLAKNNQPFRVIQLPGDGSYEIFEYEAPVALWDATWRLWQWKKGLALILMAFFLTACHARREWPSSNDFDSCFGNSFCGKAP